MAWNKIGPWTTLTTTEGDLPHGTFKAIDTVMIAVLKLNKTEKGKIKYRICTEAKLNADMTVSFKSDESLKNGPGELDVISYNQGRELRRKGYVHTLARLKSPPFSYLITNNNIYVV